MADIVERLRQHADDFGEVERPEAYEAADEIERLRGVCENLFDNVKGNRFIPEPERSTIIATLLRAVPYVDV